MGKSVNFTQGQFFVALRRLESWFERQRRVLPWRDKPTLYRVWISEIMLQQTQVATVVPYFERFLARFPSVSSLAQASEEAVMNSWAGLGYYSRARNLHRTAKIITEKGFPKTLAGWLEMPGVGPYTAGAIVSIALNKPAAILDANAERVLSRLRRVSDKTRLWRYAEAFVRVGHRHEIRPSILNQGLMEVGATLCSPKKPKCSSCPFFDACKACATGDAENFPKKKAPKQWLDINEELHCLMDPNGKVLVRKRESGEWRAGLWDLVEEKHIQRHTMIPLGSLETKHIVTRHKITRKTHVWKLKKSARTPKTSAANSEQMRWISLHSPEVPAGSALKRTLQEIRERFPETSQCRPNHH